MLLDGSRKDLRKIGGRAARHVLRVLTVSLTLACAAPDAARAELVGSVFSGFTKAVDNDLHLRQDGGTDLTFHDVSYKTRDWESPLYYGIRLVYFLPDRPHWGIGAEFVHSKMYLQTGDSVRVTGRRAGVAVDAFERVNDSIESFSLSHGLNVLTADAVYRWDGPERERGSIQAFAGGGIGTAIPHVESTIARTRFEEYQWHGPAYQIFAGLDLNLTKQWSIFAEYKLSYVRLNRLDIPDGSIGLKPLIHHITGGVAFRF